MKKIIIITLIVLLAFFVLVVGCPKMAEKAAVNGVVKVATSTDDQWAQDASEAMDYKTPITRDFAVKLIPKSHSGEYSIAQICDVWQYVNSRWTYVNDPNGFNYWSPASRTINLGLKGDCDDFAILITSLNTAIGGSSRTVIVPGHAYPEVYIGNSKENVQKIVDYISKRYNCKTVFYHHETDSQGVTRYWLNLDWSAKHPGGPFADDDGEYLVIYPDGRHQKYNNSE